MDTRKSFGTLVKKLCILTGLVLLNLGILFSFTQIHASKAPSHSDVHTQRYSSINALDTTGDINSNLKVGESIVDGVINDYESLFYSLSAKNTSKTQTHAISLKQNLEPYMSLDDTWILVEVDKVVSLYPSSDLIQGFEIELEPGSSLEVSYTIRFGKLPEDLIIFENRTQIGSKIYSHHFETNLKPLSTNITTSSGSLFHKDDTLVYNVTITNHSVIDFEGVMVKMDFDKDTLESINPQHVPVIIGSASHSLIDFESGVPIDLKAQSSKEITFEFQAPDIPKIYFNTHIDDQSYKHVSTLDSIPEIQEQK